MTHGVSDALVERLAPRTGEALLDLACGLGDPALALAARVGPTGRVVASDVVPEMLQALQAHDTGRLLQLVECAGEQPAFADHSFDGLSCRFGVMFLDKPVDTFREWRRILRPGGRVAIAVWGAPERNPYFSVVGEALDRHDAAPSKLPNNGRGIFDYAEPGRLSEILSSAGFREVDEGPLPFFMELPDVQPHELLDAQRQLSPLIAERSASLDRPTLERVAHSVAERVTAWRDAAGTGLALPAEAQIVCARRG
ncbi:MAG: methyltransferase [Planctomycetota bacterium]|nr:MAG: methyltransferase [Planctomycetota bacterium]